MNLDSQQDDFFRQLLVTGVGDRKAFEVKWSEFCNSLQSQVAHLPQSEQDTLITRVVMRNAEYMALMQKSPDALRARLGVLVAPATGEHLVKIAAETAVRATVWQSISSIFRIFR